MNSYAPRLTIDLRALAENYRFLESKVGTSCGVAGVVKANAYGLGLAPVAKTLEAANCPVYFAATMEEGIALRALTAKPIVVLGGAPGDAAREAIRHDLVPVLNSLAAIEEWSAHAADGRLPAVLHFDTGINRLGLGPDETARLLREPGRLRALDLRYIMSHFACADEEVALNERQMGAFAAIRVHFPSVPASFANSSGIFLGPQTHYELVRPGMAVYGLNPRPEAPNPMRPVVTLDTPILQIRIAQKGESVGYGASFVLEQTTRLATVAGGYADGIFRTLSNRGTFFYRGRPCPVRGRISMDLTVVELPNETIAGETAQPGDRIEILGPHQDADALALAAGTIGYEILTSLGSRYERIYRRD